MKTRQQSGFTLVEIAIVLVVIGLLLGGILRGQQLIASARVRNMADQNSGVQAAYFGFIDRFRQIPGDMPPQLACDAITSNISNCSGTPDVGGDQNGRIDQWDEAGAVWAHLSYAQFLTGTYDGTIASEIEYGAGVLTNDVPANAFQQPIILGFTDDYDALGNAPTTRLAYGFGKGVQPSLLRELDVKLDDGNPGAGVMRATIATTRTTDSASGGANFGATTSGPLLWDSAVAAGLPCVSTTETATATYNVDSDNTTCTAVFLY